MAEERKSRFERKEKPSPFGPGPGWSLGAVAKGIGVATGLGAGVYWLSRIQQAEEGDRLEAKRWQHEQDAAWKQRQSAETARGRGAFKHMFNSADPAAMNAWEEFHQRAAVREAASAAAAPAGGTAEAGRASGGAKPADPWGEFDARMKAREAATEAEAWAKYPEAMAEQARERATATGQPLDPRAERGVVLRGNRNWSRPVSPPPLEPASGPTAAVAPGPGVDIEGMKRVYGPAIDAVSGEGWLGRLRGMGRMGVKAAPWVAGAMAAYGVYRGMEKRGGVSLKNAPGAVGDEALNQVEGFARLVTPKSAQIVAEAAWKLGKGWLRGKRGSGAGGGVGSGSGSTVLSEEEVRAQFSDGEQDERMPSVGGQVPLPGPKLPSLPGGRSGSNGWGDAAPRPKRGRPFADPYHIGQARLQAEHDIEEQNEAERREAKRKERDEHKADAYVRYIEKEDRKRERARLASERRQVDYENDSDWLAQRKAWEEQRLERGGRRRHASINVNSWQAAGAVVGGFSQMNVELVRSEIERALERGDTAIRMN